MPNFCHECGNQISPKAKFCGSCGEPIEAAGESNSLMGSRSVPVRPREIEIVQQAPPPQVVIEQPVRYYEPVVGTTHHSQDFRDKTGFFDTFQQSLGSNFGGCIGQFVGCLAVLFIIFVGLSFLGALAN